MQHYADTLSDFTVLGCTCIGNFADDIPDVISLVGECGDVVAQQYSQQVEVDTLV